MPQVFFYGSERSARARRQLASELTEIVCRVYGVPPETVSVNIFNMPKDRVAHGGRLASDGGLKTEPKDERLIHEY